MPYMMYWWGGGGLGFLWMALWWLVVIGGAVLLIRWAFGTRMGMTGNATHNESPLDILKKRYAHGEINKEEFEQKKQDLL